MSESRGDTGVVDPIRIPTWLREPAERWWREMPVVARVFVALTALDILGRTVGFLSPAIDWAYLTPLGFIAAFLPHDLWILLPALLVIRRPDAASATPWIFRGAVLVAVVEVARGPLQALLYTPATATISALLGGVAQLGLAAGWVLLAHGLRALTSREPTPTVAGIANVGAGLLGILAALYLAETIVAPPFDLGDPGYDQAVTLSNLAVPIQTLGWAYLVWVVIRGLGDARRPPTATSLAAAGGILAAFVVPVMTAVGRLLGAAGFNPSDGSGLGEVYQIVSWLGDVVGPTLIAIAFSLGLAEPATPFIAPPLAAEAPSAPAVATEAPIAPVEPPGPQAPLAPDEPPGAAMASAEMPSIAQAEPPPAT